MASAPMYYSSTLRVHHTVGWDTTSISMITLSQYDFNVTDESTPCPMFNSTALVALQLQQWREGGGSGVDTRVEDWKPRSIVVGIVMYWPFMLSLSSSRRLFPQAAESMLQHPDRGVSHRTVGSSDIPKTKRVLLLTSHLSTILCRGIYAGP